MKYGGALRTESWFDVVVLSMESYFLSVESQIRGSSRNRELVGCGGFFKGSKFLSAESQVRRSSWNRELVRCCGFMERF